MDDLAGGDVGFDRIEKADELLMAMALHAAADDPAFQDVERGKQGSRCHAACNHASWSRSGPCSPANRAGSIHHEDSFVRFYPLVLPKVRNNIGKDNEEVSSHKLILPIRLEQVGLR